MSFTDLDQSREIVIFESILTNTMASITFKSCWGSSKTLHEPKTEPTIGKFSLPKSMKHTVVAIIIYAFNQLLTCGQKIDQGNGFQFNPKILEPI